MFSLTLAAVGTLLHIYVALRLIGTPWVRRRIGARCWAGLSVLVWFLYIAGTALGDDATGVVAWPFSQFALHWLGGLFYAALCLLTVDLVTGFGYWLPRKAPILRERALVVAAVLVAIALFQGWRAPVVIEHEVRLTGLPEVLDGAVLVALSDLHLGAQRGVDWTAERVAQVQALDPDLIVLLGDQVESELVDAADLPAVLQRLEAPLGVWAVTGNHEYHGNLATTVAAFEAGGVRWLRNDVVSPVPGFVLAGVDDLGRLMRREGEAEAVLASVLADRPDGATVLLSHTPTAVETAAATGVDLMLSGHTHGGQLWPFGYLVQRVFPRIAGHYVVDRMSLIVSRGAGSWGPRMRIWHPGEILRVTLRRDG